MAPVPALAKVYFRNPVFGDISLDVAETYAAVKALTVATSAAATTVGGATGRMVTITRAADNTVHSVHVDNIIGIADNTIATPDDQA